VEKDYSYANGKLIGTLEGGVTIIIPKTGQTTKVRDGDDGDYEAGYAIGASRYRDNGDGTVSELVSGLMWVKEPGAIGGVFGSAGNPAKMIWNDAIDNCEALTYAGHSDWRLPNIFELCSLWKLDRRYPCIDIAYFPDCEGTFHWTSSLYPVGATNMMFVDFAYANTGAQVLGYSCHVRPVRGGLV